MPLNVYDTTRLRMGNYDATWGSVVIGAVDKITPQLDYNFAEIKIGSLGDVKLGERFISLEAKIKLLCREVDVTQFQRLLPWYTSGSIPLIPTTWHKDRYDYAAKLTLHPTDIAAATLTEDLTFLKAVPSLQPMDRDGSKEDTIEVTFDIFPDRAQLLNTSSPILIYGYIGAAPP